MARTKRTARKDEVGKKWSTFVKKQPRSQMDKASAPLHWNGCTEGDTEIPEVHGTANT